MRILSKERREKFQILSDAGDKSAKKKLKIDDALIAQRDGNHIKSLDMDALRFIERMGLEREFAAFKAMRRQK